MEAAGKNSRVAIMVLASLAASPKHGYAIIQDVEASFGVRLGPGTLYGVLARLEDEGFVRPLAPEGRRRPYELTGSGAAELAQQTSQMTTIADVSLKRLASRGLTA